MSAIPPPLPVLGYVSGASSWTPIGDVTEHNGDPLDLSRTYFAPPPPQIGPVQTAHSNLKADEDAKSFIVRLALAFGTCIGLIVASVVAVQVLQPRRNGGDLILAIGSAVGLVSIALVLWKTTFKRAVSYVGPQGIARFSIKGSRNAAPAVEVFYFPSAFELRTTQTRHFYNGVYTGTSYNFTWSDQAGRKVFQLGGQYQSKKGTPKRSDPYWFARSAEQSWNIYQLEWVARQVETLGFAQFNLQGQNFVRVGQGFFEFGLKGEVARITVDEIKNISLNQGMFHITHKDARWFSSKGKFNFAYGNMANAQLFLLAVEKLIGYRFG